MKVTMAKRKKMPAKKFSGGGPKGKVRAKLKGSKAAKMLMSPPGVIDNNGAA